MHITEVLGILEDADSEGFQNFIVSIFDMVLEDALMFLPHALPQLEPNIFLKFDAPVRAQVSTPVCVSSI